MSTLKSEPSLKLYDSASHALVSLAPTVTPGKVTIYLCGATVQGSPHIGHMRSAIAFDVLTRWLEYCGLEVVLLRNVTVIDDKILAKSAQAGAPWWAWAYRYEREFSAAYQALGVKDPTYEPHATGHVPDMIDLVQRLIDAGHAYVGSPGNVYFSVRSLPDYGSLTNQSLDQLRSTEDESQIDDAVEADKRDPRDFALWKAAKPSEPADASWDTPWGRGRPGWHLECSAMSRRYLGDTFDIHGGGIDLRFPHHENEQAQSHGAGWPFVRIWVHNAWVTIKGEKMSKSLGNSLVVSELLKQYSPQALRLVIGTTHHRSTVEFSPDTLEDAQALWDRFSGALERAVKLAPELAEVDLAQVAVTSEFRAAMDDDLNLAGAMTQIHAALKRLNVALTEAEAGQGEATQVAEAANQLRVMLDILGLDPLSPVWARAGVSEENADNAALAALGNLVENLLEQRASARKEKDWGRADAIRDALASAGVVVEDSPPGARCHLG